MTFIGCDLYHETWDLFDSSKIKEYISCPRRYMYHYILGWDSDQPNIHLEFGEAYHRAMEILLRLGYNAEAVTLAIETMNSYYYSVFNEMDDAIHHPKTPSFASNLLVLYVARYAADQFQVHATETGGTLELPSGSKLTFRMDSILEDDRGIFTMDHKTGSARTKAWGTQWALDVGISTYICALYCLYPPERVWGAVVNGTFFRKTDAGKKFKSADDLPFERAFVRKPVSMMEYWLSMVEHYIEQMRMDTHLFSKASEEDTILNCFHQNPTDCTSYGSVCPYHAYCTSWENPLRRGSEVPVGMIRKYWSPLDEAKKARKFLELKGGEKA